MFISYELSLLESFIKDTHYLGKHPVNPVTPTPRYQLVLLEVVDQSVLVLSLSNLLVPVSALEELAVALMKHKYLDASCHYLVNEGNRHRFF